jgi:hypothetical protein
LVLDFRDQGWNLTRDERRCEREEERGKCRESGGEADRYESVKKAG